MSSTAEPEPTISPAPPLVAMTRVRCEVGEIVSLGPAGYGVT